MGLNIGGDAAAGMRKRDRAGKIVVLLSFMRYLDGMAEELAASFDFAEALTRLKAGQHVTRLVWCGYRDRRRLDIWLDGIKRPHLIVRRWHGEWRYWEMRNDDVMAEDWIVWEPH